jgi:hypothetical protein
VEIRIQEEMEGRKISDGKRYRWGGRNGEVGEEKGARNGEKGLRNRR